MSQTGTAAPPLPPQIIIVRRGGESDDGHHGGAWKIAFADFMTAMMAFFLVMWLTNASDDATKKQIAQYFNPIKLNSSTPETLGLEPGENAPPAATPQSSAGDVPNGGDPETKPLSGAATGGAEEALFRDPYAVLAEIAAEGGSGVAAGKPGVPDGSGLPGLNGGEAYRDPFDPNSWSIQPNIDKADPARALQPAEFQTAAREAPVPADGAKTVVEAPAAAKDAPQPEAANAADAKPAEAKPEAAKLDATKPDAAKDADAKAAADAARLEAEIRAAAPGAAGGVEVTAGEGGVTISLADSLTSGMFEIGSAKPTPEAVKLVEKIAKLLAERQGAVVIRGHTDARPYAGVEYDNWRLSTARAHMAYYMLARGGFDENRVVAIEGYGDRQLKDVADPFDAVNRRIEILLKEPAA